MTIHASLSHNPYFNRWFSAIICNEIKKAASRSHNPYFNRWFSAIEYPPRTQWF